LSSGQHRELLLPLIDWFGLTVDADLQVMSANQSLSELTARLMRGFEEHFKSSPPDLVLAQGDTTTVMCAALSCFYLNIPFGHVEAGLRTFDVRSPSHWQHSDRCSAVHDHKAGVADITEI
jgi:UDP-N-acetylglucosamine 2-epimerase (non-hydrolysing)